MGCDEEVEKFKYVVCATPEFERSGSRATPGLEGADVVFRGKGSMSEGSRSGGLRSDEWAGWRAPELEYDCVPGEDAISLPAGLVSSRAVISSCDLMC